MSARARSSSVGSKTKPKLHRPSRAESAAALALDVRCACQFYETLSLLPERVNPVGYNLSEEFEPCIHVRARMKELDEIEQEIEATALPRPITIPNAVPPQSIDQMYSRPITPHPPVQHEPTQMSPINNNVGNGPQMSSPVLSNRSVSCNNMGAEMQPHQPNFIKQRDPSTSSLLRKRMSEERGLASFDKRISQSTTSRDQFIVQKDLSQSTILRNKANQRSGSQSLGRGESMNRYSSERTPQPPYRSERIPNERTFYHDSNMHLENAGVEVAAVETAPVEIASPSGGNRRFILASTENLPQNNIVDRKNETHMENVENCISVEAINHKKNDVNFNQIIPYPNDRNVSDEEKVQALLSKAQKSVEEPASPAAARPKMESNGLGKTISSVMPGLAFLQLMNVEEIQAVETNVQAKPAVQYLAKFDSTLYPKEAETTEYSNSKLFDNYCTSVDRLHQPTSASASNQDLNAMHARQRDPLQSPFTRDRYRPSKTTSTPNNAAVRPSEENLLESLLSAPTTDLSKRQSTEQMTQSQFIRQKDPNMSTVLNRRRRNLSQIIVPNDTIVTNSYDQPVKITTSMSFERSLGRAESERQMNFDGSDVRIMKGVSFEMDRMPLNQANDDKMLDNIQQHAAVAQMPHR